MSKVMDVAEMKKKALKVKTQIKAGLVFKSPNLVMRYGLPIKPGLVSRYGFKTT